MPDQSYLDERYFVTHDTYNCPFCNRRHVTFRLVGTQEFDWTPDRCCLAYFVRCKSCQKTSMHLSREELRQPYPANPANYQSWFRQSADVDAHIFYSVPTSFFTIDDRIPRVLRELISEGDGCRKMNFLTGASACLRKAIYEFLRREEAEGERYKDMIRSMKARFPEVDPLHFDVLASIQSMTSDKVHEASWTQWDAGHLSLFSETLRAIFHEVYVVPDERKKRADNVKRLQDAALKTGKKG